MTCNRWAACLPLFLFLAACSSDTTKKAAKKEPPKPPEPISGRRAFHQMYAAARSWATDLQVLRLESINLPEPKSQAGRAGAWRAVFVSPGRARMRAYTYSTIEGEGNLHKGVFALQEEGYSGPRGPINPFLVAALKIDSDEALKVAMEKGAEYAKKNPDKPIYFLLENNKRHTNPSWRVVWGESISSSNFSIFVDASTGQYVETMR